MSERRKKLQKGWKQLKQRINNFVKGSEPPPSIAVFYWKEGRDSRVEFVGSPDLEGFGLSEVVHGEFLSHAGKVVSEVTDGQLSRGFWGLDEFRPVWWPARISFVSPSTKNAHQRPRTKELQEIAEAYKTYCEGGLCLPHSQAEHILERGQDDAVRGVVCHNNTHRLSPVRPDHFRIQLVPDNGPAQGGQSWGAQILWLR
ncbi:hypothetical protein ScPMuIL_004087 [Solemya velum]